MCTSTYLKFFSAHLNLENIEIILSTVTRTILIKESEDTPSHGCFIVSYNEQNFFIHDP